MNQSANSVLALFIEALKRLFADEAVPLAGNIAFRTMFSIFPFLIFVTSLAGFFGSADLAQRIIAFLLSVAPEQLVHPLSGEITAILTVQHGGLVSLSAALTIWSAMGGVDSIRVALNRAYDIKEHRSIWFLNVQNVLFVIGAAIVLLAVAILLVVFPLFISALTQFAPDQLIHFTSIVTSFDFLRYPVAIGLLMIALLVAHQFLPARTTPILRLLPGIVLTIIVWVILSGMFSFWLSRFNSFTTTYASLSGIFAAMFFLYLAALVLIFGGEFNRVLIEIRKSRA
jgi:membrane protein